MSAPASILQFPQYNNSDWGFRGLPRILRSITQLSPGHRYGRLLLRVYPSRTDTLCCFVNVLATK